MIAIALDTVIKLAVVALVALSIVMFTAIYLDGYTDTDDFDDLHLDHRDGEE